MNDSATVNDFPPAFARFLEEARERDEELQIQLGEIRSALEVLAGTGLEAKTAAMPKPSVAERHGDYKGLIERVRRAVRQSVPVGATVAVVSKGDPELLQLEGRRGWHFPQDSRGNYAGFHPADSPTAIANLEEMRARGAEYLLIPQTALWWLEHYREFREHLESRYAFVVRQADIGAIVRLSSGSGGRAALGVPERPRSDLKQLRAVVRSILPEDARLLVISKGDEALQKFDQREARHFPCAEDGGYAGYYPADSDEAITRLDAQIDLGWQYLVVPAASAWWLEFYEGFARHLYTGHRIVARQRHVAFIFQLAALDDPS